MAGSEKQNQLKSQIQQAANVLKSLAHVPSLAIGIDLDGCIDEAPDFFRTLSHHWLAPVYVIPFRRDLEKANRDVERFGIRCTEIVLVSSFEQKAKEIADRGVFAYFDDQDEVLMHLPPHVNVFKIRNGGNFDFDQRKWLYSEQTGRRV